MGTIHMSVREKNVYKHGGDYTILRAGKIKKMEKPQ
jgi:hypothetical protein